jgi:uncharacterized protein DUF4258
MNKEKAKRLLRSIALDKCLAFSKHCRKRMGERGVTADDFLNVLFWGKVTEVSKSEEHDNFRCTAEGKDLDGDALALRVAIFEKDNSILCITVFG